MQKPQRLGGDSSLSHFCWSDLEQVTELSKPQLPPSWHGQDGYTHSYRVLKKGKKQSILHEVKCLINVGNCNVNYCRLWEMWETGQCEAWYLPHSSTAPPGLEQAF